MHDFNVRQDVNVGQVVLFDQPLGLYQDPLEGGLVRFLTKEQLHQRIRDTHDSGEHVLRFRDHLQFEWSYLQDIATEHLRSAGAPTDEVTVFDIIHDSTQDYALIFGGKQWLTASAFRDVMHDLIVKNLHDYVPTGERSVEDFMVDRRSIPGQFPDDPLSFVEYEGKFHDGEPKTARMPPLYDPLGFDNYGNPTHPRMHIAKGTGRKNEYHLGFHLKTRDYREGNSPRGPKRTHSGKIRGLIPTDLISQAIVDEAREQSGGLYTPDLTYVRSVVSSYLQTGSYSFNELLLLATAPTPQRK